MKRAILLKYGELILKGDNRNYFEAILMRQIKKRLAPLGDFSVKSAQSTVFVESEDDALLDQALPRLLKVFGIISVAVALKVEKNMDAVLEGVRTFLLPALDGKKTFKADAKRSDKAFPLTSPEIARAVGSFVLGALGNNALKVDVHHPEITLWIEIRDDGAYLHAGKEKGAGGMPYGTNGKLLLLLSGGLDSPVAGFRMARRGAAIDALHFESFPYTSERALEKVSDLARRLASYTGSINFISIRLTDLQLALKEHCREDFFTILLRRSMMRLACRVARHQGCGGVVTGESLGQVASQTLEALAASNAAADLPVFRPLCGMDKEEIVETSRKIDCYDLSVLPYEDCCTVFTPRHPRLHPTLGEVLAEEQKLDLASLEDAAFEQAVYKLVKA